MGKINYNINIVWSLQAGGDSVTHFQDFRLQTKKQTFLLRQLVQTFILYTINLARTFSFQNVVEEYQRKCFVLLRFKKVFAFLADTFISQNNRNRDKQHFFVLLRLSGMEVAGELENCFWYFIIIIYLNFTGQALT